MSELLNRLSSDNGYRVIVLLAAVVVVEALLLLRVGLRARRARREIERLHTLFASVARATGLALSADEALIETVLDRMRSGLDVDLEHVAASLARGGELTEEDVAEIVADAAPRLPATT